MRSLNARIAILGIIAVVVIVVGLALGIQRSPELEHTDIVTLTEDVSAGRVAHIEEARDGQSAVVSYTDASRPDARVDLPASTRLTQVFSDANVPLSVWPTISRDGQSALANATTFLKIGLVLLIIGGMFWFVRRSQSGFGRGSSRRGAFDPVKAGERTVLLSDVAGAEELKEEIADVIEFLREPEKFHRLGARIPRGVLLVGPPGTGKTLMARAVAGEARASFFAVSGSEFVELYVGVGASRVRELFRRARECAPAIVFVDEIDSIGRKRGRAEHSTEYDQTLNQILVEMDGFDQRSTVVVIAATNRVDILDPALLRPGRFDRKVYIDLPDRAAREAILRVHSRGKPLAASVNLAELAARTTGMSGADLANLVNEAAILSGRRNSQVIEMDVLVEAIDRTLAGAARKGSRFSQREREVIAYHEAGHALVAHYLPNADSVRRVSIVSRGQAGGYTMIVPDEDRGLWTRQQLTDRLAALLGGFAAEEIVFGDVTTGSSNDLERVSSITLSMVSRYGMGETFGLLSTGDDDSRFGFSQRTAFAAESEARTIVDTARDLARSVLITHRSDLERLADYLLEHETVEGDELVAMFGPATTAAPRPKLPVPLPAMSPVGVARPPQQGRRRRVVETLITSPATVVASIRLARRRRLLE